MINNIKTIKHIRKLTLSELAEKSGVSENTIKSLINGKNNICEAKINTLVNISLALKCNIYDLYTESDFKNKLKKVVAIPKNRV